MSLYIQKRKDVVLPAGIYQGRVSRIRSTRDGESVMIIVAIDTQGYQGVEVTGFCKANWNPPTGRTTANLRQWVMNLGVEVIDGQEASIDLECLKGRACSIVVAQYKSMQGETKCKIMNIFPLNAPVPNPMPEQPKQGFYVGAPKAQPVVAQAAPAPATPEVPPTPVAQPIPIQTVKTPTVPPAVSYGAQPAAAPAAQPAPQPVQQPAQQPVQQPVQAAGSEDGFKW